MQFSHYAIEPLLRTFAPQNTKTSSLQYDKPKEYPR